MHRTLQATASSTLKGEILPSGSVPKLCPKGKFLPGPALGLLWASGGRKGKKETSPPCNWLRSYFHNAPAVRSWPYLGLGYVESSSVANSTLSLVALPEGGVTLLASESDSRYDPWT